MPYTFTDCECGSSVRGGERGMIRHYGSKNHIEFLARVYCECGDHVIGGEMGMIRHCRSKRHIEFLNPLPTYVQATFIPTPPPMSLH